MINLGEYGSIGDAWIAIIKHIIEQGIKVITPNEVYYEYKGVSIDIHHSLKIDPIISKYGDEQAIHWMKNNFEVKGVVKELRNARSYASRLYDYAEQKNQIDWVVNKLRANPFARSVTITTFEPLTDFTYIPCVSLLDFDISDGKLDLYIYARALDFGGKAYANLICLQDILDAVACQLGVPVGKLHLICKSVHFYDKDYSRMISILSSSNN